MTSLRSSRAWIPAAVAPVSLVVLFFVTWGVNKAVLGGDTFPKDVDASFARWILEANNTFFGIDPFSSGLSGRILAGTLVSVALLLVVGFLIGLVGVRGLAPGSSAIPVFLSLWTALVLACVVAGMAAHVVDRSGQPGFRGEGRVTYSVFTNQMTYGVEWGWIAALLATLVWLAVRPRADAGLRAGPRSSGIAEGDDAPSDEFVSRRRTGSGDFRPEPVPGDQSSSADPATTEPAHVVEDTPGDTYVGKYSTGRYAGPYSGSGDSAAPSDDDPSGSGPGGSHRADPNG